MIFNFGVKEVFNFFIINWFIVIFTISNNKIISGMGLSILFDGLLKATKIPSSKKTIFVPLNHDKNLPIELRKKGWITILSYKNSKSNMADAIKANCSHLLDGKSIKKIKS